MEHQTDFVEDYVKFVSDEIKKIEFIGDLIRMDEVPTIKNRKNGC